jgi:Tyrosine phosphatase family
MIHRLKKITNGLYRGSAPSPKDVEWLKNTLDIKKIVSLDQESGDRIDHICQALGIQHIDTPIDHTKASLIKLLSNDLKELLLDGGPTYLHCLHGKDRTGLIAALFKCKYMGMKPERAIKEAESLGFGIGVHPSAVNQWKKLIRTCKPSQDMNNSDIVSNQREFSGDNRDSFLDEGHQGSFSPYLSVTRQNPMDAVYTYINDQYPTRENYKPNESIKEYVKEEDDAVPQVGVFNNDAGGRGFGPTENYSGFFYD